MIKILAGTYRSRNILTPDEGTEPTKNRVREAMMSAVYPYIQGATVLDLFAGSGALGIEALSRGAKKAYFVDVAKRATDVIHKNLDTLKERNGVVLNMSFMEAIATFHEPFDLVFLDPPYAMKDSYQQAIDALCARALLKEDSAVVVEYEGQLELRTEAFSSRRDYTYGKTKVILLKKQS